MYVFFKGIVKPPPPQSLTWASAQIQEGDEGGGATYRSDLYVCMYAALVTHHASLCMNGIQWIRGADLKL